MSIDVNFVENVYNEELKKWIVGDVWEIHYNTLKEFKTDIKERLRKEFNRKDVRDIELSTAERGYPEKLVSEIKDDDVLMFNVEHGTRKYYVWNNKPYKNMYRICSKIMRKL